MRNKFHSITSNQFLHSIKNGFTLVELLIAAGIATVVGGSALYVINDFHTSSIQSSNRRNLISSVDTSLRVITNEVKQSIKIYPSKDMIKKEMGGGNGLFGGSSNKCVSIIPDHEFLFAIKLPDQVLLKGDYFKDLKKPNYKSKRIKQFIASDCNFIFYGIKSNLSSQGSRVGPYYLYRRGYDQTAEGYYNPNSVSTSTLFTSIADSINSPNGRPANCPKDYFSVVNKGIQVCIDRISQRTINLSLVSKNPNSGNNFNFTRSISASTNLTQGGSIFSGIQPTTFCNNAVFILDKSGSMRMNMQNRKPPITRMELARVEIIDVVRDCPDGSKFNVYTFAGRGQGASFKPSLVILNDSIRVQLKNWLDTQTASGSTYPWDQMGRAFTNSQVENMHVIGDGVTYKNATFLGQYGDAASIFKTRNAARKPPLNVYSYSLDYDFCTGSGHNFPSWWLSWIDVSWMGRIADSCKFVQ